MYNTKVWWERRLMTGPINAPSVLRLSKSLVILNSTSAHIQVIVFPRGKLGIWKKMWKRFVVGYGVCSCFVNILLVCFSNQVKSRTIALSVKGTLYQVGCWKLIWRLILVSKHTNVSSVMPILLPTAVWKDISALIRTTGLSCVPIVRKRLKLL